MTDAFKPLSLSELMALELPIREWVVDGILPLGSFTMLAAREKAGKSLILTDLVCSVALGEPFLGLSVRQGPAVLVPAEDHIRDVRERIVLRLNGRTDVPIYVLPVNGFTEDRLKLSDPASVARLAGMVTELAPILVALDPFRELHDLPENDSDFMGPLLRPIRQLSHATETAIVMAHHMNRGGTARGSTGIKAAVDQEWAFTRTDDDSAGAGVVSSRGVLAVDGRFGPRQRIGMALGPHVRWSRSDEQVAADGGNIRRRILAVLPATGDGLTADDVAKVLGANKPSVQNAFSAMLRESSSPVVGVGAGTKSQPRRFLLAPHYSPDDSRRPTTNAPCDVPRNGVSGDVDDQNGSLTGHPLGVVNDESLSLSYLSTAEGLHVNPMGRSPNGSPNDSRGLSGVVNHPGDDRWTH